MYPLARYQEKLRMKMHVITSLCVGLGAVLAFTGCQSSQYIDHSPQTYFDFPNSNVKPIGPVKVEVPGPSGFFKPPDMITSDSDQTVYAAAIKAQPGANLIVNYTKIYKAYSFFPFTWSKLQLQGTACSMDVGTQVLKQ